MPVHGTRGAASVDGFGFGGGSGPTAPTLIAPLGFFIQNPGSTTCYFFNVDTESWYTVYNDPNPRFSFDPVTGNIYATSDSTGTNNYYVPSGNSYAYAGTYTQGGPGYNGRPGPFYNSNLWNSIGNPGNHQGIYNLSGGFLGNGPSPGGSTEDATAYGNIGWVDGYGFQVIWLMNTSSISYTSQSLSGALDWGTPFYDNRTGLFSMPLGNVGGSTSPTGIGIYYNKYSSGAWGASTTSENLSSSIISSGVPTSFGSYAPLLITIDPSSTSGSLSTYSYGQVGNATPNSAIFQNNGTTYSTFTGYWSKTTPVWSYKNKAYYMVGDNGAIKIPLVSGSAFQLSTSVTYFNYPPNDSGLATWRGPCSTNSQLPCYLFPYKNNILTQ